MFQWNDPEPCPFPCFIFPFHYEQQTLTVAGAPQDQFGYSVAIEGDTIVVGAPFDNTSQTVDQGAAFAFSWNGSQWAQSQKLQRSAGAGDDHFGTSVAVSGDTIVIGVPLADLTAGGNQGAAIVFERNGGWIQGPTLTAGGSAESGAQFGSSVAISGDAIVVGAPFENVGGDVAQGSAYVFVRSGAVWMQEQKVTASDGAGDDRFGFSVAIGGDTIVAAAARAAERS